VADEAFWSELLFYLRRRELIPIAGPGLNVVTSDHADRTLTEHIARRLVDRYGLKVPIARMTMGEATAMIIRKRGREAADGLYPVVCGIIEEFNGHQCAPLRDLAAITDFRLYISTTPDTLLAEAIRAVRYDGERKPRDLTLFPSQSTEARAGHEDALANGDIAVVRLFGQAASTDQYAIHEEDQLEWLHFLLRDGDSLPEWIMHPLRHQPLLFIGCDIPDWLGRFLLRLWSETRLSGKGNLFYFVGTAKTAEKKLAKFFDTYCHSMRVRQLDMAPTKFVSELRQRWEDDSKSRPSDNQDDTVAVPLNPNAAKFFISYAREDIDCARRLFHHIRRIGGRPILDERRLRPGEKWSPAIEHDIRTANLLLAILSANTERFEERYVFHEWQIAVERQKSMLNKQFIVPVIIERQYNPTAYRQVPPEFRDLHFGRAPGGEPDPSLLEMFSEEIRKKYRQDGMG
jgi:hypothetical protein